MQQMGDYTKLLQIANSPAGQQLISMLQNSDADALQQAVRSASAGNYTTAMESLSGLLQDPKVTALLKQLGGEL